MKLFSLHKTLGFVPSTEREVSFFPFIIMNSSYECVGTKLCSQCILSAPSHSEAVTMFDSILQ